MNTHDEIKNTIVIVTIIHAKVQEGKSFKEIASELGMTLQDVISIYWKHYND